MIFLQPFNHNLVQPFFAGIEALDDWKYHTLASLFWVLYFVFSLWVACNTTWDKICLILFLSPFGCKPVRL